MTQSTSTILSQLPESQRPAHSVEAAPLKGAFGISAILPSLQSILDHQEGISQFTYGYYRLATRPLLYRLQEGLKLHYGVRHCIAYTSSKTALMEVLDTFLLPHVSSTLYVIESPEAPFSFHESLKGLNTRIVSLPSETWNADSESFPQSKSVLLIAHAEAKTWMKAHSDFLKRLKKDRIPCIVFSQELPDSSWNFSLCSYWVSGLGTDLQNEKGTQESIQSIEGGVLLSNADRQSAELLERQKRRGGILCTRNIAKLLNPNEEMPLPCSEDSQKEAELLEHFCDLEQANAAFLFPSGMNAIASLMTLLQQGERTRVIVIGLLFSDTQSLILQEKVRGKTNDSVLLGLQELDRLPELMNQNTAAIITETITNPLIDVPDLEFIAQIAQQHGVPFIVDNTLATPFNCKPFDWGADYVIHSTTKYFSGNNEHGGGLLLTRTSEQSSQVKILQKQWGNTLSPLEMRSLWQGMQNFEQRMKRFNHNGIQVAQFLEEHPWVKEVFYCGLPSHRSHKQAQKLLHGYGSLIGVVLNADHLEGLRNFYDADLSPLHKAPSLGSDETLICPYTILAHYHASEEHLKELGLSRYLVRIAVGSEPNLSPVLEALNRGLSGETMPLKKEK